MLDFGGKHVFGYNKELEEATMLMCGVEKDIIAGILGLEAPDSTKRFLRRSVCRGYCYSTLLSLWEKYGNIDRVMQDTLFVYGYVQRDIEQDQTVCITEDIYLDLSGGNTIGLAGSVNSGVFECMGYRVNLPIEDGDYLLTVSKYTYSIRPLFGSAQSTENLQKHTIIYSDESLKCDTLEIPSSLEDGRVLYELYVPANILRKYV